MFEEFCVGLSVAINGFPNNAADVSVLPSCDRLIPCFPVVVITLMLGFADLEAVGTTVVGW